MVGSRRCLARERSTCEDDLLMEDSQEASKTTAMVSSQRPVEAITKDSWEASEDNPGVDGQPVNMITIRGLPLEVGRGQWRQPAVSEDSETTTRTVSG